MNNGEEDWQENITFCLLRGAFANPSKIILETGSKRRHAKALQERVAALSSAMRSDTLGVQKGKIREFWRLEDLPTKISMP